MSQVTNLVVPKLIVGLGNPGAKYDRTRHNIGFSALDALAQSWQVTWQSNRRFQGLFGEANLGGVGRIFLLKPQTYMNLSGQSVRAVVDWYKLSPQSILIIYDDMDLPIGKIRMRLSGSAGGHNGMKSIISHLGGQDFPRLRLGIGKSNGDKDTIAHVLGKFSPQEKPIINELSHLIVEVVELSLKDGVEKAMSLYNGRNLAEIIS